MWKINILSIERKKTVTTRPIPKKITKVSRASISAPGNLVVNHTTMFFWVGTGVWIVWTVLSDASISLLLLWSYSIHSDDLQDSVWEKVLLWSSIEHYEKVKIWSKTVFKISVCGGHLLSSQMLEIFLSIIFKIIKIINNEIRWLGP